MAKIVEWNALVPAANRLLTPNQNERAPWARATHIVIHVTGTNSLAAVKKTFLAAHSVSAHYLVGKDGALYQFAPDAARTWHAGIEGSARRAYARGPEVWPRYLKYFSWYKGYPEDARFVDGDLQPVWDKTEAAFVTRADGQQWPEYAYLRTRWPNGEAPINFTNDPDPNNYSIGIETLGVGAAVANPKVYTPAMYDTLARLLADLSGKYGIPIKKGRVVGHEDVNPIGRFGWDPGLGFDWSLVHK